MLLQEERELIVEYGKKLITHGLARGTGGNISIFNRQQGLAAISPSALDYMSTTAEDIAVINCGMEVVAGHEKASTEADMHMIFYQNREDIDALVHTHSVFATTLSCLHWPLPPVHYLVGVGGRDISAGCYSVNPDDGALRAIEAGSEMGAAGGNDIGHVSQLGGHPDSGRHI